MQFYPTNPLCLSDGNTTDRELTGDWAVGIHCGHQLTASAGDDTAVREPCSLKEELRKGDLLVFNIKFMYDIKF